MVANNNPPKMMKIYGAMSRLGIAAICLCVAACENKEQKMARGFVLPKGDIAQGKAAFVDMKCHDCHSVYGTELSGVSGHEEDRFELGGKVRKVKSYGELVTAIINPQHKVSKEYLSQIEAKQGKGSVAQMPTMNDKMTVEQMIDIAEFLNSRYEKKVSEEQSSDAAPYYYGPTFYGL